MQARLLNKIGSLVPAITLFVLFGVVTSCATSINDSGGVATPSASAPVDVKVTNDLHPRSDFVFEPATDVPSPAISVVEAVLAAKDGTRGEAWRAGVVPLAELAYVSYGQNVVPNEENPSVFTLDRRLCWVVEIDDVPIAHSVPMSGQDSVSLATVQWLIDANTGDYIMAADF